MCSLNPTLSLIQNEKLCFSAGLKPNKHQDVRVSNRFSFISIFMYILFWNCNTEDKLNCNIVCEIGRKAQWAELHSQLAGFHLSVERYQISCMCQCRCRGLIFNFFVFFKLFLAVSSSDEWGVWGTGNTTIKNSSWLLVNLLVSCC